MLDAPRRELLRLIYSRQGQQLVADGGYIPIAPSSIMEKMQLLGIELDGSEQKVR